MTTESPKQSDRLRLISVGAAALIVAVIAFLLLTGGEDDSDGEAPLPPVATKQVPAEIVTAADLRALSAEVGHPVYWVGERPGADLELTREANGDVYIRYLTGGAEAGDPRPRFVTVGTYPVADAVAATTSAATAAGSEPLDVPHGGIAFVNPESPGSVYVAYPDSNYQIEVFTPAADEALRLVTDGDVVPVG